jgi:hypothetical protein
VEGRGTTFPAYREATSLKNGWMLRGRWDEGGVKVRGRWVEGRVGGGGYEA